MTELGLIFTSGDLPGYRAALAAMDATWAKIIPAWFPHPPTALAPRTLVRSSWGDPSYDGGRRAYPDPARVVEEFAPWAAVPGVAFEIGNEPNVAPLDPRRYGEELSKAVSAVRAAFPGRPIVAGSLSMNHTHRSDAVAWLIAMGPALRACDAVAIHAYTPEEAETAARLVRQHVNASLPLWMTEVNVNAALSPAERARQVRAMTEHCAVGLLYHWAETPGADPVHFNPHYRLSLADLAAMRQPPAPLGAAPLPDAVHYTERLDGFTMAVIQWRTVAAFRRHLSAYRAVAVAPWARGVTLHCTESPLPSQWAGIKSMLGMARFYRDTRKWKRGPHIYSVSGAPNPLHDGIWQLNPLNLTGVHAESFNATHWGWEVVDNPVRHRWDAGTAALVLGGIAALHDFAGWQGVTPATLNGHRDDPRTDKTCPGAAIDLADVRRGVAALRGGAS